MNLSDMPSIQEITLYPDDSIPNCESRSSAMRYVNIFGYRNDEYLYYGNGRDYIKLKDTVKPIGQERVSVQDNAVRKF
jgi:hypothetical protein